MKTADDLYFGGEISGVGSDEKFELTNTNGLRIDDGSSAGGAVANLTKISVRRLWSGGTVARDGY
jgi:hypothetical protein